MSSFRKAVWPTQWLASKRNSTTSEKTTERPPLSSTNTSGNMQANDKKKYIDPITGDALSLQEHISWLIQGIIRRWLFIGIITVCTIICWVDANQTVLTWWNYAASYMALFIESVVGIAMFSQTRRDAVLIRTIAKMEKQIIKLVEHLVEEVEELNEDMA